VPPCGRRPFLGENRSGCPLTPDVLGRRRPLISRVLGAAPGPFTVALSTRIRFAFRPAAPAGNRPLVVGAQGGRVLEETHDKDQIIQRVAALDVGTADRLAELGVTRVVMEATSDYWKGVYYLLEAHGFEVWLVNARDVKHLP